MLNEQMMCVRLGAFPKSPGINPPGPTHINLPVHFLKNYISVAVWWYNKFSYQLKNEDHKT